MNNDSKKIRLHPENNRMKDIYVDNIIIQGVAVKVIKDDGTKYVFEDNSWVMIRFSGTEDLVRYYLEFPTEIEVERNLKAIKTFIEKYQNLQKNVAPYLTHS